MKIHLCSDPKEATFMLTDVVCYAQIWTFIINIDFFFKISFLNSKINQPQHWNLLSCIDSDLIIAIFMNMSFATLGPPHVAFPELLWTPQLHRSVVVHDAHQRLMVPTHKKHLCSIAPRRGPLMETHWPAFLHHSAALLFVSNASTWSGRVTSLRFLVNCHFRGSRGAN